MTRRVAWGAALAALLVAANIVTDGYPVLAASLVLAPMSVALFGDVRETAIVAVLALLGALVGAVATDTWTSRWFVAVIVAAVGSALAVVLAALRVRAESEAANAQRLTRVERRLTSALDALGEAVTVMSADSMVVYVNDAAVHAAARRLARGAADGAARQRSCRASRSSTRTAARSTAPSCPATGCCTARPRRRRCSYATSSSRPARSAGCSTRPR